MQTWSYVLLFILKTKGFANVDKVSNLINVNFQSKPISMEYKFIADLQFCVLKLAQI